MEWLQYLLNSVRTEIVLALAVIIVLYVLKQIFGRRHNYPDGPMGLPIVGYMPFLTRKPHEKFIELGKKYGDVFSLKLGTLQVIVLNNGNVIREAFSKPELAGRPDVSIFDLIKVKSPFFSNGRLWQEHRRFALHSLRDLGLGKTFLQEHIKDEINHLMALVEKKGNEPFDVKTLLTPSMSNNICSLVFGKRYEYDDPERKFLDNMLDNVTKFLGQTSSFLFFPWLQHLPLIGRILHYDEFINAFHEMNALVKRKVQEHKETLDPNNPRDFIDTYLIEMKARTEKDPDTFITENFLPIIVQGLFGAGSETVRTSVGWCLYTMAAYPKIQAKVQQEIDNVIGRERSPDYSDQKNLPYTQSVLLEMARWRTVAPINLLRLTLSDTTIKGYNVPKDTVIIANLWAAHHDPETFANPGEFVPDRFLNADGTGVIISDNHMPFSYGKRACPGEGLAVVEVFLYFTTILQKFEIALPKGEVPSFEGDLTITYSKKPHKLCFRKR